MGLATHSFGCEMKENIIAGTYVLQTFSSKINFQTRVEDIMNLLVYTVITYSSDIILKFIPYHCCMVLACLSF